MTPAEFQRWLNQHWLDLTDQLSSCFVQLRVARIVDPPMGPDDDLRSYSPEVDHYAGFLVAVGRKWALVTAGHVFQRLDELEERGSSARIIDLVRLPVEGAVQGAPFVRLDNEAMTGEWCVHEDLDWAYVLLGGADQAAAERIGLVPLGPKFAPTATSASLFAALGSPHDQQLHTMDVGQRRMEGRGVTRFGLLPLHGLVTQDVAKLKRAAVWLTPITRGITADSTRVIESAEGMSGGPVFKLRLIPGGVNVELLGLVTHWDARDKTMGVCPIAPVIDAITRAQR